MQYYSLHEYRFVICLKKKYSWKVFKKCAKVDQGSYSEAFVRNLYSSVFDYAIDLRKEYGKYYKDEYSDIGQYLFWRHGVSYTIQKELLKVSNKYVAIINLYWEIEENDILGETFTNLFVNLEN